MPEFDIPVLDPYYTESHSMEFENGQQGGKMLATDIRTYGLAKARFLSVKPEMVDDLFRLEIDVEIPKILIDGNYKAEGYLASFRVGGKGILINTTDFNIFFGFYVIKAELRCFTRLFRYYFLQRNETIGFKIIRTTFLIFASNRFLQH